MRDLESLPVDGVMIFPPLLFAWGKVDPNLKVRFFEDLARETKLPIVLFQVPVKSYYYDPETVCRIARLENVLAFKEASFDINLFTETIQALKRDKAAMRVLTGNDRFVAESYKLGANGALIGVANVATEKWGAMDIAGRAGKFDEAAAIQHENVITIYAVNECNGLTYLVMEFVAGMSLRDTRPATQAMKRAIARHGLSARKTSPNRTDTTAIPTQKWT